MPAGHPLPSEVKAKILTAYKEGHEAKEIAERFGVARSTVTMIAHRAGVARSNHGSIRQKRIAGSPDALTDAMGSWVYGRDGIARFVKHQSPAGVR